MMSLSASLTNTPGPRGLLASEQPCVSTSCTNGRLYFAAHARVVLAEGRGDVDDAGAVGHGDVVCRRRRTGAFARLALAQS